MPRVLAALLPGIFIAVALNGAPPAAQQPSTDVSPAFEVASVKLNASGGRQRFNPILPGGQFSAVNMPLADLVRFAYGLSPGMDFLLTGGPPWLSTSSYDVSAKIDGSRLDQNGMASLPDVRLMLRGLLRDRFKLVAHTESRELPMYTLAIARSDGKLGPLLRRSGSGACPPLTFPAGVPPPPLPPPPPGAPGSPAPDPNCTWFFFPNHVTARQMTLARFADVLSGAAVHRPIVDRTGLEGLFDLDLDFLPDLMPQGPGVAPPPPGTDPNAPSIFTAVQEQLGLKLESTKGPVDVLVIDHVERPTAD